MTKKAGQTPAKKGSKAAPAKAEVVAAEAEIKLEVQIEESPSVKDQKEEVENGADNEATEEEEASEEDEAVKEEAAGDAEEAGEEETEEEEDDEEEEEVPEKPEDLKKEANAEKEDGKSKDFEVFIGGLPEDTSQDDIKSALQQAGEIVEIRLMKKYAFVRFTTKEEAVKASTELKNIKIKDKLCEVVPREEDTVLFLGNINILWKKSKVDKTLKQYGVRGIRKVTLKDNPKKEGTHRGFAIIEFRSHEDARNALRRLSRKDAVFGKNRSAKVKWLYKNEPDEVAISQVKSVVVKEIPPSWTEDNVKPHFSKFGEIERITLNHRKKKSKEVHFAVIEYSTHEAAAACVDALKDAEIVEGEEKVKLNVRLPNPPHTKPRRKVVVFGDHPVPLSVQPAKYKAQLQHTFKKSGRDDKPSTEGRKRPLGYNKRPYEPSSGRTRTTRQREPEKGTLSRPRRTVPVPMGSRYSRPEETRLQRRQSPRYRSRYDDIQNDYSRLPPRVIPEIMSSRYTYDLVPPVRGDRYSLRADQDFDYRHDASAELSRARDYIEPVHSLKRPYSSLEVDPGYYAPITRALPKARIDPITTSHLDSYRPVGGLYSNPVGDARGLYSNPLGDARGLYSNPVGDARGLISQSSVGLQDQAATLSGSSLVSSGGRSSLYGATDYISSDAQLRASALLGGRSGSSRYGNLGSDTGPYY